MSDDECEVNTTKEEASFLELPKNLTDVTWKEDLYPIEVHLTGEINSTRSANESSFREAQPDHHPQSFRVVGETCTTP